MDEEDVAIYGIVTIGVRNVFLIEIIIVSIIGTF